MVFWGGGGGGEKGREGSRVCGHGRFLLLLLLLLIERGLGLECKVGSV